MDIGIGGFGLSVILFVILTVIYKTVPTIPDRFKALVAVGCGIGLGMIAMAYKYAGGPDPVTVKVVIEYVLTGLMVGAASVGIYEGQRALTKPRK